MQIQTFDLPKTLKNALLVHCMYILAQTDGAKTAKDRRAFCFCSVVNESLRDTEILNEFNFGNNCARKKKLNAINI